MTHREVELNDKTNVPLGLAIGATIFICGLVLWAGRIEWVVSATAENTKVLNAQVESYKGDVQSIRSDLLMIKCQLKVPDPACLRPGQR